MAGFKPTSNSRWHYWLDCSVGGGIGHLRLVSIDICFMTALVIMHKLCLVGHTLLLLLGQLLNPHYQSDDKLAADGSFSLIKIALENIRVLCLNSIHTNPIQSFNSFPSDWLIREDGLVLEIFTPVAEVTGNGEGCTLVLEVW